MQITRKTRATYTKYSIDETFELVPINFTTTFIHRLDVMWRMKNISFDVTEIIFYTSLLN